MNVNLPKTETDKLENTIKKAVREAIIDLVFANWEEDKSNNVKRFKG